MRRMARVLTLLGISVYLAVTSVGCCCTPCYPYRTAPYYCVPSYSNCYQPAAAACPTASNDRIVPTPMPQSGTLIR